MPFHSNLMSDHDIFADKLKMMVELELSQGLPFYWTVRVHE